MVKKGTFTVPDLYMVKKDIPELALSFYFFETTYDYLAIELNDTTPIPEWFEFIPLRIVFAHELSYAPLAARAANVLTWSAHTVFCCQCGSYLQNSDIETAKICTNCGKKEYPQIIPAVIVLIKKKDKILLARHRHRINHMFTCLAGYMEAGENAEECVSREVYEETRLKLKNIHYFGSQSWPFPNQLMIGFTAEWESGTITIQEEEIEEAKWFSPNNLPVIPEKGSMAYRLIQGSIETT
ncbi:MAG TPA: NAD(+) diphosphatase [Treponemataceae bacterium]|nr:NAD(+) diphosphatase [Treponemataceae bacterium]